MSVLVYIESADGIVKKSSIEAICYASQVAKSSGTEAIGVIIGNAPQGNLSDLGKYGIAKIIHVNNSELTINNIQAYATALKEVADKVSATALVFAKSSLADPIAARLSIKLNASIVTNVTELPSGNVLKRAIFTGKAFANVSISSEKKIFVIRKNATTISETGGSASVETITVAIPSTDLAVVQKEVQKATGQVLLPEAELVVSGGRGLKGPENWGIIEDLAKTLGAATGCSKPVSDADWRPHHEHVGQTGVKVSPNLYIAVGISGAIQHLAGVNSSKCIVVINKDPEAPFFKAADYGIVGDAFEVLPKLNEAFKKVL
jgi:electron transfer flavoprotein alpha subunit